MTPAAFLFFLASALLLGVVLHLRREVGRRTRLIRSLCDRVHAAHEVLGRAAARRPALFPRCDGCGLVRRKCVCVLADRPKDDR
jgi:hypothetical protein